ncbi:hypothetical protein CKM354_001260500 [Cercospora kikuchii]|uniref:RING-type domain-containing protein n=1 Tax=Cercospora kikuchii TaxID=84275 RepID=A0A9P3FMF5_9PEZI|nr:uncharacterized protein CKM354_001260500 [Cercospora kikuchii]GIZ49575.1 hypothetical protein CKM354_001260500 [Cercospora kikuchii]
MSTQQEFLLNPGLVPLTTTADCMICHEEATNPVKTSSCECSVLYCQSCILAWFRESPTCPTCPFQHFSVPEAEEAEQAVNNEYESDDEDGPPTFDLDVTVETGEADELIYLLHSRTRHLGDQAAVEHISNFRRSSLDANMVTTQYSPRRTHVKTYLLVDYLLADANIFYEEQLDTVLETSLATEEDFRAMVRRVGIVIENLHDRSLTYEGLHEKLLMGALNDLSWFSRVWFDMWEARRANREIELDPIQRYLEDIVEELVEEGERLYHRIESSRRRQSGL